MNASLTPQPRPEPVQGIIPSALDDLPSPAGQVLDRAALLELEQSVLDAAAIGEKVRQSTVRAIVRTVVPAIVGLFIATAAKYGIDIPDGPLTEVVGALCIGGYYAIVTFLERKVHPAFGYLLGAKGAPSYIKD